MRLLPKLLLKLLPPKPLRLPRMLLLRLKLLRLLKLLLRKLPSKATLLSKRIKARFGGPFFCLRPARSIQIAGKLIPALLLHRNGHGVGGAA